MQQDAFTQQPMPGSVSANTDRHMLRDNESTSPSDRLNMMSRLALIPTRGWYTLSLYIYLLPLAQQGYNRYNT